MSDLAIKDLISVIVPVFNRRELIGRALESVQKQTYPHWELLIIDDGSTDGTERVVEAYACGDARVRLLRHGERKGAQAARNTGIRAARGHWIAFLDSDDRWFPRSLEVRFRLATEQGLQVIHSDFDVLRPGDSSPQRFGLPPLRGSVYEALLRKPGLVFPGLLVSREALDRIGELDEAIVAYQEWETAIRLAKDFEFGFVGDATFSYEFLRTDSISKNLRQNAVGYEQVFVKHRSAILTVSGPTAVAHHYAKAAGFHLDAGERVAAVRCLAMAVRWWPKIGLGWISRPRSSFQRVRRFFAFVSER